MKVLASDYDGTLFINDKLKKETSLALKRWRTSGHRFGIVTGRDLRMTRDVILEHGLKVDFAICNNGCVLYDGNLKKLHSSFLSPELVDQLIDSEAIRKSCYIVLADEHGRYVYDNDYRHEKYEHVYYTEVLNQNNIKDHVHFYQMDTRYSDAKEMHEVKEMLEQEIGNLATINPNVSTIDITPLGVTKLTGLQRYLQLEGLEKEEIITVGDGLNDLSMILHYGGYTMMSAVPEIKEKVGKVVESVEELIEWELNPQ